MGMGFWDGDGRIDNQVREREKKILLKERKRFRESPKAIRVIGRNEL